MPAIPRRTEQKNPWNLNFNCSSTQPTDQHAGQSCYWVHGGIFSSRTQSHVGI